MDDAPLAKIDWPVCTERLEIRPATVEDLEPTWTFRRLDEVSEWITRRPATFEEYAEAFLDPDALSKTLVIEHEREIVGDLMLSVGNPWSQREVAERAVGVQAELGWTISPAYSGRGFGTEAARALLRICFEGLGLRRVTAECFAANEASWRIMESIGMRREAHTVRDSLHRSGEWLDGYAYALLAEEWRP
jgi:RimJ/RimL family protein N-acetyltransferase